MKFKKLGLARRRGEVYVVRDDGTVMMTTRGDATAVKVARVKLVEPDDFLYFIDDDGDLAREFRPPRKPKSSGVRVSATKPASAALATRALYDRIDALLFPADEVTLAHAGFVDDPRANAAAAKVYAKEYKRLVAEISRALGPGRPATRDGQPGVAWELRGRWVRLALEQEDKEFPGTIVLRPFDPDAADA